MRNAPLVNRFRDRRISMNVNLRNLKVRFYVVNRPANFNLQSHYCFLLLSNVNRASESYKRIVGFPKYRKSLVILALLNNFTINSTSELHDSMEEIMRIQRIWWKILKRKRKKEGQLLLLNLFFLPRQKQLKYYVHSYPNFSNNKPARCMMKVSPGTR